MASKKKGAARLDSAELRARASKRSPFAAGLTVTLAPRLARQIDGLAAGEGIAAEHAVEWLCRQAVLLGRVDVIAHAAGYDADPEASGLRADLESANAALRTYRAATLKTEGVA